MRQRQSTRSHRSRSRGWVFGLLVFALSGALAGAAALKLPGPIEMPKSADSPGKVVFSHESHVDPAQPRCTTCHPKEFRILKSSTRVPVTHERMDKGGQCGSCHNGKAAFALDQDCTLCHSS